MRIAQSPPSARRVVIRALLLATAAGVGCSRDPAPPPPPAWPDELAADHISFGDPEVDRQFRAIHAAAQRLAGNTWEVRDVRTYRRESDNPSGWYYTALWASSTEPRQPGLREGNPRSPWVRIRLELGRRSQTRPDSALGERMFTLIARTRGSQNLVAEVHYTRIVGRPGANGLFRIQFSRAGFCDGSDWACSNSGRGFELGRCVHSFHYTKDGCNCYIQNASVGDGEPCQQVDAGEVGAYWRSPESFRDTVLASLDGVSADVRAGRLFIRLNHANGGRYWSGEEIPAPEAVKAAAARQVESDIERDRAVIRNHFREMHAVATAAFPELGAILDPGQKK